jgi:hypothetical protein
VRADIAGAAGDENGWTFAHRLFLPSTIGRSALVQQ